MNRFEIFHKIVTRGDLSSVKSLLRHSFIELLSLLKAERGAYFVAGAGGLRCLNAFSAGGMEITRADKLFPGDLLHKACNQGVCQVTSWLPKEGGGRHRQPNYYLAVPMPAGGEVTGVACIERRGRRRVFQPWEKQLIEQVFTDLQAPLKNSGAFQKQNFEIDAMKAQIAQSRVQLISQHPSMLDLFVFIRKLAAVPATVLIQGESGTGKELVARALYEFGAYSGPFVAMNCGGIETGLLKSELFGYLKGSFTGAQKDRPGLFKKAGGGVLFMDEIGEMPADMQVALLRTLELGEILPVGADIPEKVNTRVVAATHRDLAAMVKQGQFRNDLYQRIKGFTLQVPPLRQRRGDIPLLCEHFIQKYNQRFGMNFQGLSKDALNYLCRQELASGNVRELEHIIERAMVYEDNPTQITTRYLTIDDHNNDTHALQTSAAGTFDEQMNRHGAQVLETAIEQHNGNKTRAMKSLGLSRSSFYHLLNRYGVGLERKRHD